jgi:hypothetical protein
MFKGSGVRRGEIQLKIICIYINGSYKESRKDVVYIRIFADNVVVIIAQIQTKVKKQIKEIII